MCTNSARLVSSLECYMDELVENFEDFVKKSLLIISIAVGALIVMLGYVLKVITERAQMVPIGSSPAGEGWSRQYLAGSPVEERTTQFLQGSTTAEGWSRFLPGSTTVEERQEGERQTEGRQREERQAGGWTRFLPGSTIAEGRQEETKQADEKQGEGWATRIFPGSTTVEGRQAEERQVEGGQAEDRQAESRQGGWLAAGKQTGGGQAQGWLAAGKQTVGGLTQERQTEEGQAQGRQAERGQPQERQAEGRQAVGWLAGGRQADGGQAQERQPEGGTRQYFTNLSSSTEYPQSSSNTSLPVDAAKSSRSGPLAQRSANALKMKNDFRQTSSIGAYTSPMSSLPSFDEKVLRNVGLSSCSKSCMQGKRSILRNCSSPRIAIPSMPTCIPNHHLSNPRPCTKYVKTRSSCCSMCCADDDRR